MNVLVCISKVPDTTSKIQFTDGNTKFDEAGVTWIMNPTDEWYALVRAVEVKEAAGGTVTVINVGGSENDQIIRKALAIGADSAVRIDAPAGDAYFVAAQIAEYAKDKNYDIIFTGKETIDYNSGVVASMIAELLGLPHISVASHLDLSGNTATIEREIEGGSEKVTVNTPFVLGANKGLAEQRIPNMRGIMMARKKPITVVPASASFSPLTETVQYEPPKPRESVKLVDSVDQLVDLLHNEAKAI